MFVESKAESQPSWSERLNAEQLDAVFDDSPSLLVVAGAGTGKTGTIAARVARLISEGVDPDRILLLTFTRRAAAEMLDRVASMTDRQAANRVWGGTFHSVANRLLRTHAESLGLSPSFTVLGPGDVSEMFALVRSELDQKPTRRRFPRAETLAAIYSRMVNGQVPLSEVITEHFPWCAEHHEAIREVSKLYVARKRRQQVLDYDDLLLHLRAFAASEAGGAALRARFDHVLVDEYQDTNPVQADIVLALSRNAERPGANITVVGDDAQAIYGFRAATVENLWSFTERFHGARMVSLTRNYRSTQPVLDVANGVLAQSQFLVRKELHTDVDVGPIPRLVTCDDEGAQSNWLCDELMRLRDDGLDLRDQAVLFRAGHHSAHLELELARRNIPFVKFGGLKFLEAGHIKDLLSLMRVLDNPGDELAWNRTLRMLEGVGPATVTRLLEELDVAGDPDGALRRFIDGGIAVSGRASADVARLREAWADCGVGGATDEDSDVSPAAQVDRLTELCALTFPRRYENPEARVADLEQLAVLAGGYQSRSRFLTEVVLDPPERTGDLAGPPHLDDEYLTLSTIHSAKGCEWTAVHLLHAADGNMPSDMALGDAEGLDEELRLAYVAVTRARAHLNVLFPLRYHIHRHGTDDRHHFAQLSRFFSPIRDRFDVAASGVVASAEAALDDVSVDVASEVDSFLDDLLD
ncbi:MAG: ATP-dependent helicase [Actinomycetia bacterium]|nr:ATP-dependent helicase [Actinomycetes bacterium]